MDSTGENNRTDAAEARSSTKRKAEALESDKSPSPDTNSGADWEDWSSLWSSDSDQPQGDAATQSDIYDHGFRPEMPRAELPLELPPNNSRRVKPGSSI